MAKRRIPTPEEMRQLLRYEPETGKLFWKPRPLSMFKPTPYRDKARSAEWAWKSWNTRFADREAFTANHGSGHKMGIVCGATCKAHRVVWAIYWGESPPPLIDHINGNGSDNRISNLRAATEVENARNQGRRFDNASGATGVSWHKGARKWQAAIHCNGKRVYLGCYARLADAIAVRKAAESRMGYHHNHGERLSTWKPDRHKMTL